MEEVDTKIDDQIKIKTLCEYLFFDQFQDTATFSRFEQCFQPLFNNINISMEIVFKDICGPKKKYITYKRFAKSYLNHMENKDKSKDTKIFFEKLLNLILKEENSFIGQTIGNIYSYSTKKISKNRDCISKIQVLCNKEGIIHGINLEYDGVFQSKMYPQKIEDELYIYLEISLGIIEDHSKIEEDLKKFSITDQGNYRDAITHIFGTLDNDSGFITFLGFKCISGKTLFVGFPKGDGFLFGKFGNKLHNLKIQMKEDGLTLLKPGFKENIRKNFYLDEIIGNLSNQNLDEEEIINDEEHFIKLKDDNEIDKLITTSILEDDYFFNNKLKDDISGYDYKEVVDQHPRKWLMNSYISNESNGERKSLTLDDALKRYDIEFDNRNSTKHNLKVSISSNNQNNILDDSQKNDLNLVNNDSETSLGRSYISSNDRLSLHKSKIYKPLSKFQNSVLLIGNKVNENKINFKKITDNDVKKSIIFNKENYHEIKDKLGIMINDDIVENDEDADFIIKKSILNDFGPNKNNKEKINIKKSQITIKNLKGDVTIIQENNNRFDSEKYKLAQKKWRHFREGLEKINGLYLLQTIGSVMKAIHILANDIVVPVKEKVKLYKLLDENEKIVDFLSQDPPEYSEDEEKEILLIPNENPEKINSLPELQKYLDNIKELLENKKLKEEDKKKLEQLRELYLKQKNILIENESKNGKSQLIKEICINVNNYIQKEKEKRQKAQEEEKKKLEKEMKKKKEKEEKKKKKKIKNKSIIARKVSSRIYKKQKMPEPLETWTDDIFPAKKESLCPFDENGWIFFKYLLKDDVVGWEDYKWCRIEEIEDFDNYDVFVEGATIDDIKQGDINDCYFLSAIGSLCNYSDFFDKLFHIKEKSEEHAYGIYLYLNGKWKLVLVDDYFPYSSKDYIFKELCFSCSVQNELWVSLLEKAWAKVNGCYAKIGCGGFSYEAFDVLTEAYTEQIDIKEFKKEKKEDDLWYKMENSFKKKYVLTAGTPAASILERYGLCPGHAYTLINTYKVNTDLGEERLIKLKNPWGNTEFTGDWSDYSEKWTPELKAQCEYPKEENEDDGIFYMSYDDFIKYFSVMDIAKLEPGYQTTYIQIKKGKAKKCQVIRLIIKEDNPRTYIQLYQKNPRILNKKGDYYPEPVMGFIILVDSKFHYIKSICGNDMHIAIEVDLKPGTYYIFCDVNYRNENNNKNYGYTMTFYSKNIINNFEIVTERIDVISALEISMYDYCKQKVEQIDDESGMKIFDSKKCNKEIPFRIFCFINITKNPLKVKLDIKYKNKKFCIYNDRIACEFDTSVIKEVKSINATTILIMEYSNINKIKDKYGIEYEILSKDDKRTYENTHPVFNTKGEEFDDKGNLMSYYLSVDDDKGYSIGLDNISNNEYNLKLILDGVYDIDSGYIGKDNIDFKILPKEKRVFNVRFKHSFQDASFDFKEIK